jgi:dCTP deaminase
MWLSANEIDRRVRTGEIALEPFDKRLLKPASYVLRLGTECLIWRKLTTPVQLAEYRPDHDDCERLKTEDVLLLPGTFVLASSFELLRLPANLIGVLSTLSHIARFGLSVLQNSTLVSPGFGQDAPTALTFELFNSSPNSVQLRSGLPICHLGFQQILDPGTPNPVLHRSVYERQISPALPKYRDEFSEFCRVPKQD